MHGRVRVGRLLRSVPVLPHRAFGGAVCVPRVVRKRGLGVHRPERLLQRHRVSGRRVSKHKRSRRRLGGWRYCRWTRGRLNGRRGRDVRSQRRCVHDVELLLFGAQLLPRRSRGHHPPFVLRAVLCHQRLPLRSNERLLYWNLVHRRLLPGPRKLWVDWQLLFR